MINQYTGLTTAISLSADTPLRHRQLTLSPNFSHFCRINTPFPPTSNFKDASDFLVLKVDRPLVRRIN